MTNDTIGKLFVKVATLDKSARLLAGFVAMNKVAAVEARKQFVRGTVAQIMQKQAADAKPAATQVKDDKPGMAARLATGLGKAVSSIPAAQKAVGAAKDLAAAGKGLVDAGKAVVNPKGVDTTENTWAQQLAAQSLDPKVDSNAARTMREYLPKGVSEPVGDTRSVLESTRDAVNAEQGAQDAMKKHQENTQAIVNKYMEKLFGGK